LTVSQWPVEPVPDEANLFRLVHRFKLKPSGLPRASAFTPADDGGVSTEWDRYASVEETRELARTVFHRSPEEFAVVGVVAGDVRSLDGLLVQHTPRRSNRAHTDIIGTFDEEVRVKLARMSRMVLALR
jgi:hypothetical protein